MARQNTVFLLGQVYKEPKIKPANDGGYAYAMCYVEVVRSPRNLNDGNTHARHDIPIIITKTPSIAAEISTWKKHDIVLIKGVFTTRNINKTSHCPHCAENGHDQANVSAGTLAYIEPIFAEKITELDSNEAAERYLAKHKEISNNVFFIGNLTRDPKKIKTEKGLILTQYQIAANRKFKAKTDLPENRTDYPWVKIYGEHADDDKQHLHCGSGVFIDGALQARSVKRTMKCPVCGEFYSWKDKTMEIVSYETEYLSNFYDDEEIEKMRSAKLKENLSRIYGEDIDDSFDDIPEDEMSEED